MNKERSAADFLFLKAMEECGEAVQAIAKMLFHGPEGKWDDGSTSLQRVSEELSDVSTVIALLLDLELLDSKAFWAEHEKKHKKFMAKIEKMVKERKDNNDSNGRAADSDGQSKLVG